MRSVIPGGSWAMFWVQVALALLGYMPMAFSLLVPPADRNRFLRLLKVVRTRRTE